MRDLLSKFSQVGLRNTLYVLLLAAYFISSSFSIESSNQNDVTDNFIPKLTAFTFIVYNIYLFFLYKRIPIAPELKPFMAFMLVTFASFCIYCTQFTFVRYLASYFKVLMWLISMNVLYKIFITEEDWIKDWISRWFCLIFTIGAMITYFMQLNLGQIEYGSGSCIYVILPLIFLVFKDSKFLLPMVGMIIIISFASMMRKPVIICLGVLLFMNNEIRSKISLKMIIFIVVIMVMGVSAYLDSIIGQIMARTAEEAEEGEFGSGRTVFWNIVWNNYLSLGFFQQLIGAGNGSVRLMLAQKYGMAIGAHNGFLDCIYSYGIIGIIVYLRIFISGIKSVSRIKNALPYLGKILLLTMGIWFFQNIVYFGFSGPYMVAYSFIFSYIFSSYNQYLLEEE